MNKWLRRKRNSWGYGVQSPNDFYFVQHVLREKFPYYGYAVLEELAHKHHPLFPSYPASTNQLLFRLANYVHPDTIIEVGAGTSAIAMSISCPSAQCIAIISSDSCHEAMLSLLNEQPQLELKKGDEMEILSQLIREFGTIDLLHIAHTDYYQEAVDAALPHVTDHTLIVVEDICSSKEKHKWWKSLQESERTGITYDLKSTGLIFFDRSRHKNSYWINLKK